MQEDLDQLRQIYEQLKSAESDAEKRLELLERSSEELARMINKMDSGAKQGPFGFLSQNGAKGGAVKSSAKRAAARENGAKGGRPTTKFTFQRFSPDSLKALAAAHAESKKLGRNHWGTEHLLLGLLSSSATEATRILTSAGMNLEETRDTVRQLDTQEPLPNDGTDGSSGVFATLLRWLAPKDEALCTIALTQALEASWEEARKAKSNQIETEHLLLGLLDVPISNGVEILTRRGVQCEGLRRSII